MQPYELMIIDLYEGGFRTVKIIAASPADAMYQYYGDECDDASYYEQHLTEVPDAGPGNWKLKEEETLYIIRAV